jgi:two-component sensor histidine kinase
MTSAPTGQARLSRYDSPLGTSQGVRHVRETLARSGVDGGSEQATDALLVAGELLANAWQHGGGARSVELSWRGNRLRIAVSDSSREPPRVVWPHAPARTSGHGLYLVECLSGRGGSFARPDGKTVWAELRMLRRFGQWPATPPLRPRSGGRLPPL